jgi:hypothetical protein
VPEVVTHHSQGRIFPQWVGILSMDHPQLLAQMALAEKVTLLKIRHLPRIAAIHGLAAVRDKECILKAK